MKKIFLMAYARKNLGDDLFIKMLLDRFPMQDFYIKIMETDYLSGFKKYKNLHIIKEQDADQNLYQTNVNDYDVYIYVGGSIFMEGKSHYVSEKFWDFIKRCKKNNKPFYYLSCNYGPYYSQNYIELSKKIFRTCTDICFRDKYSFNLFKEIEQVRYAPDWAFTYPTKKANKLINTVGISIIDLSIRNDLKAKEQKYINMLEKNITNYINQGKDIYLFSFCKFEGDDRTINKVLKRFQNNEHVKEVKYDGNIDEFIEIYSQMEYSICTRFHAMVLSCITEQKIYVISYSNKINNVISDLQIKLPIHQFSRIEEDLTIKLEDFKQPDSNLIKNIIEEAKKQQRAINNSLKC